jgi:hypothetical protein
LVGHDVVRVYLPVAGLRYLMAIVDYISSSTNTTEVVC